MIVVSTDFLFDHTLSVRAIFKLEAPELISTKIKHYFIVIAIDKSDNYLVLCTSQGEKKEVYFKKHDLDLSTLVYISPDEENGLTCDTFVDCNRCYRINKADLIKKDKKNKLEFVGRISSDHYMQIVDGIKDSYINDMPKYLLKDI